MERRELERRGQKQRDSGGEGDRATGKGGETRVAWIKCHGEDEIGMTARNVSQTSEMQRKTRSAPLVRA